MNDSKELLRNHIITQLGKSPEGLESVLEAFVSVEVPKNTVLLEVQQVCRRCYFIVSGCLKIATYNLNGAESTTDLAFEGEWRTSMSSFLNQEPANERIVAIESSHLLYIDQLQFHQFCAEVPVFSLFYKNLLESSYTQSVERIQTLMSLPALERVQWLLQRHPRIFLRLSNRQIAAYLGIAEATLSRLKTKL